MSDTKHHFDDEGGHPFHADGAASSLSLPHYSEAKLSLVFSNNSVHNTTITGAGYAFEVSTPPYGTERRITTVYLVDTHSNEKIVIGEIDWNANSIKPLLVRMYGGPWELGSDFLKRKGTNVTANIFESYAIPLSVVHISHFGRV